MKSIFLLQWQRFRREPLLVLAFFILTIIFVFVMAGVESNGKITIYTYGDDTLTAEEKTSWIEKLNESDALYFEAIEEEEARKKVEAGDVSLALQLKKDNYQLLITVEDELRSLVNNHVNQVMTEELRLQKIQELGVGEDFRLDLAASLASPALRLKETSLSEQLHSSTDEEKIHVLYGMTLFFVIFTIMFSLLNVAEEKHTGTWDRIIVSPLRKWDIYLGHLLYCFIIGYAQMLVVFLLFKYAIGFNLGNNVGALLLAMFCYVFAIVALGVLIIGLVKSPQHLQAVIPIVATAMAMLGGAFWPIEIVSNEIIQFLAKGTPIMYGMDALKQITLYGSGIVDVAGSLSILILIGVVCTGIGINLMERRL